MKPLIALEVPGSTEWERFDNALGELASVPKVAYAKEEAELKRRREKIRVAKVRP